MKFWLKCLETLHEEVVDGYNNKIQAELTLSHAIKDHMRAESILPIIGVLKDVLTNYADPSLDKDDINSCLNIYSQLIDWNDLGHFKNVQEIFKGLVGNNKYRE